MITLSRKANGPPSVARMRGSISSCSVFWALIAVKMMSKEGIQSLYPHLLFKLKPPLFQLFTTARLRTQLAEQGVLNEVGIGKRHATCVEHIKKAVGRLPGICGDKNHIHFG